jgi:hypothetical protein
METLWMGACGKEISMKAEHITQAIEALAMVKDHGYKTPLEYQKWGKVVDAWSVLKTYFEFELPEIKIDRE